MKMKELTRLYFKEENGPISFEATEKFIDNLKKLHNLNEIFIWPGIDKEIDFLEFDPENVTATPYKETFYLSLRVKE